MKKIITGDRHLQSPREGDLLRRDHRVHRLGQCGQAPRHHQACDTSDDQDTEMCVVRMLTLTHQKNDT